MIAMAGVCLHKYTGTHCMSSLLSFATCESSENDDELMDVYISNNNIVDQISTEEEIGRLIYSLDLFIQPSEKCRSAVIPFLCLYTFGVCGANNDDYRPTAAQCMEIRDSICESEWKKASDLLALAGLPPLPDCSSLDDEGLDCEQGKSQCF